METVGTIESLWRYPVKSMAGEEVRAVFAGFAGLYGDRIHAFCSAANRAGFPFLTAREQRRMLRFRPRFRLPEKTFAPPNLAAAESIAPGITPVYAPAGDFALEVETPAGPTYAIDDPALADALRDGLGPAHQLTLLRSERALTDCRPLALISLQTVRQLSAAIGRPVDRRRFRANIHLDLASNEGFGEDQFVGRSLRVGAKAVVAILQRDPRCTMINFDPETGETMPEVLKTVARGHDGNAGVYAAVLVEGVIRQGDPVVLLDP